MFTTGTWGLLEAGFLGTENLVGRGNWRMLAATRDFSSAEAFDAKRVRNAISASKKSSCR